MQIRENNKTVCAISLLIACTIPFILAQAQGTPVTGEIRGKVCGFYKDKDKECKGMPRVRIEIKSTLIKRSTVTNGDGEYILRAVPVNAYTITANCLDPDRCLDSYDSS